MVSHNLPSHSSRSSRLSKSIKKEVSSIKSICDQRMNKNSLIICISRPEAQCKLEKQYKYKSRISKLDNCVVYALKKTNSLTLHQSLPCSSRQSSAFKVP